MAEYRDARRCPQRVESRASIEAACRLKFSNDARNTRATTADIARDTPVATDWLRSIDYRYFTLIWPICSVIHQSSSNWILPYVIPLFRVTLAAPEYVIKESRLPEPLLHHG